MKRQYTSAELIDGIVKNDMAVFRHIEKRIKPGIKKFVLRSGGNSNDTNEVFQISMIKVFEKIRNKSSIDNFEHYLFQTCRNVWIDKIKAARYERIIIEEYNRIRELDNDLEECKKFIETMDFFGQLSQGCRDFFY